MYVGGVGAAVYVRRCRCCAVRGRCRRRGVLVRCSCCGVCGRRRRPGVVGAMPCVDDVGAVVHWCGVRAVVYVGGVGVLVYASGGHQFRRDLSRR